jgi:hypothetical protein
MIRNSLSALRKIAFLSKKVGMEPAVVYFHLVRIIAPPYKTCLQVLKDKRPFLITSTGRTGTGLLAKMLDSIPGCCVVHEASVDEGYNYAQALSQPESATEYMRKFRLREMAFRIRGQRPVRYGEINGCLRRHVKALRDLAPFFTVVHVVRDGRATVGSAMNRITTIPKSRDNADRVMPPGHGVSSSEWYNMTRFEKVCWIWAHDNAFIRENSDTTVKFEHLVSDYDYFAERLLSPLDLSMGRKAWSLFIRSPIHPTRGVGTYPYDNWTPRDREYFWDTCGDEMKRSGYGT